MLYARCASQFVGMIFQTRSTLAIENILLLFTHHYPARCFGMNMPNPETYKPNSIAAAIWNEFWLRYCERSEQ